MISNAILKIFEFDTSNALIDRKLNLLVNCTCKQTARANEIFAQSSMLYFLMSIILSESSDPLFIYRNLAVLSLYNIMTNSISMQKIFIQNQSIQQITDIFLHIDDSNNDILPELMKLMSTIIRLRQYTKIVDDDLLTDFIHNCLFRLIDFNIHNASKFDYFIFTDFISISKENLNFLTLELKNSKFRNIFYLLSEFDYANIFNILSLLSDIFFIFSDQKYDPSILPDLINLNELNELFTFIGKLNIDNDFNSKLAFLLFDFTFYFFRLCTDQIDSFFSKKTYKIFLKYLTNGSYKIRCATFKAIESMISINDSNKQILIKQITSDFFIPLIDFLDSESSEIVESVLQLISSLFDNEDKRDSIKVTVKMKMANDSFRNIEELMLSEKLSEKAVFYCRKIMENDDCVLFYCDTEEFEEEEEEISDNYPGIEDDIYNFFTYSYKDY